MPLNKVLIVGYGLGHSSTNRLAKKFTKSGVSSHFLFDSNGITIEMDGLPERVSPAEHVANIFAIVRDLGHKFSSTINFVIVAHGRIQELKDVSGKSPMDLALDPTSSTTHAIRLEKNESIETSLFIKDVGEKVAPHANLVFSIHSCYSGATAVDIAGNPSLVLHARMPKNCAVVTHSSPGSTSWFEDLKRECVIASKVTADGVIPIDPMVLGPNGICITIKSSDGSVFCSGMSNSPRTTNKFEFDLGVSKSIMDIVAAANSVMGSPFEFKICRSTEINLARLFTPARALITSDPDFFIAGLDRNDVSQEKIASMVSPSKGHRETCLKPKHLSEYQRANLTAHFDRLMRDPKELEKDCDDEVLSSDLSMALMIAFGTFGEDQTPKEFTHPLSPEHMNIALTLFVDNPSYFGDNPFQQTECPFPYEYDKIDETIYTSPASVVEGGEASMSPRSLTPDLVSRFMPSDEKMLRGSDALRAALLEEACKENIRPAEERDVDKVPDTYTPIIGMSPFEVLPLGAVDTNAE